MLSREHRNPCGVYSFYYLNNVIKRIWLNFVNLFRLDMKGVLNM